MKLQKALGATGEIWQVFIRDSSSTTGGGLTGLVFNSAGLTAYYNRDTDASPTVINLVTMTAGTFTSSGFKEISSANMPGWYQFCPPNAALASGAKSCGFHLKGAANMAPLPIEVQLLAVNVDDAVRMGMTALPNAAAEAAGGLFTRGTGAGQINQDANGRVDANLKSILGTALTETAGQIAAAFKKLFDVATPVLTAASVNQTGDAYARLGAPVGASISTDIAGIQSDTDNIQTRLPAALVSGRIDANVGAMAAAVITATAIAADAITDAKVASDVTIASVTGAVGSVTGNVGGNVTGSVGSVTGLTASNLDVAVSTRLASGSYTSPPSAATIAQAVWDALTSALTTVGSIGKLLVTNIDAAVSSRSTYAGTDTSGTTTLLGRLTSTRAGLLDHLDADISSRLAAGAYTAPDNAGIAAIEAKTNNLPADPADASDIAGAFTSLQSHGDGAWATATGFSTIDAAGVRSAVGMASANLDTQIGTLATDAKLSLVKAKTDNLPAAPADESLIIAATNALAAQIGAPAGASIAADISSVKSDTGNVASDFSTLSSHGDANWATATGFAMPGDVPLATDNAAAVLAATYEGAETVQDHFRLARSALVGKANGLAGTTAHYRDAADIKNRITATVDADGNRSAVTTDAT